MDQTAPSAEELVAHTDWLMGLARALVGEAAAGDVVQDTYEVALKQPPARPGPLRPWLGGVARNVARMATRGRVRREQRELRTTEPGDVPTPEELVARALMQQRIAKLVVELPEPLRATLLLRYFEGLTAAEIARAQGIPAGTVRSRLKDALDRLRAALDEQHAGKRAAWVPLVAPLGKTGGVVVVKTSIKILIAVVVALALVVATRVAGVWGGGGDSTPKQAAKTAPTKPALPAVTPAAASTASAPLPIVYEDDPKGTLRLEGQVIDDKDAPVGGARVAIDANPPIVVTTEADGAFVFDNLIARDYRIEATSGDGYAGPTRLRLRDNIEPITLRLRKGQTLEVAVTARDGGAPVKGADVEFRSTLTWKATTNADGIAQLRGVGPAWSPLVVRAHGFAPAGQMLETSGIAGSTRVAIALLRGAAISGRVVDEAGKPVAGARVVPTSASEPLPVVDPRRDGVLAGKDGSFTIATVSAGTWRLTATHGDFAPTTSVPLTVDGEHARSGVQLVLGGGGIVRGVVRDKAGKPVAAADVRVVAQGHVDWRARRQAFTDGEGKFAIAGLARRAVDVVAWHTTGASQIVSADLGAQREHDVALVLDISGTITGTVVDKTGQPIGDAQVIAEPDYNGGVADRAAWSVRGVQETVTDQGGAFQLAGLPDGSYRVRAARGGTSEAAMSLATPVIAKPGAAPLRIVVPGDGRVIGKVQTADGKAPSGFQVRLAWAPPALFAGSDGSFAMTAPVGTHPLTINGLGFVETRREVKIADGKDTDLGTITVAAGRSVSGRVLDDKGLPVAKATVAAGMLLTGGGSELYIKDESIGAKDTETDADGRFVLDGFPPAAITLVAGKANLGRSASLRIPRGAESVTVDVVLQPTTGLAGTIVRSGAPLADTVVIANPIGATASNFFVVTGPDGTFALDALAPGAYVVYPMIGGGGGKPKDMYMRRVDVELGKRAKADIDATPGAITLAITVKTDKGEPVPMAQLMALQAAIDPKTLDELRDGSHMKFGEQIMPVYFRGVQNGAAEITGMRAGTHTICVMFGDPMMLGSAKFKCVPAKLTAATKQTVTVTVPAALL